MWFDSGTDVNERWNILNTQNGISTIILYLACVLILFVLLMVEFAGGGVFGAGKISTMLRTSVSAHNDIFFIFKKETIGMFFKLSALISFTLSIACWQEKM